MKILGIVSVKDGNFVIDRFSPDMFPTLNVGLFLGSMQSLKEMDSVNRQLCELANETTTALLNAHPMWKDDLNRDEIPLFCWRHAATDGKFVAILPGVLQRVVMGGGSRGSEVDSCEDAMRLVTGCL
jgi:hypothetical protein